MSEYNILKKYWIALLHHKLSMTEYNEKFEVKVSTEIGRLRKLLIHSPDSGLGKVVPSKAQDWLFEDIVHLDTIRKDEYDYYVKLLMYFLDPDKIKGRLAEIDSETADRKFFKPDHPDFHSSVAVIEIQNLLSDILKDSSIRKKLPGSGLHKIHQVTLAIMSMRT